MTGNNGFFQYGDSVRMQIGKYRLAPDWWSRHYEYVWALSYAERDHVCADMGCGWMQRPFKDMLAERCDFVLAVDADQRLLDLTHHDNMQMVVADITKNTGIEAESLDRVYCISVLEDLGDKLLDAMYEFERVLKPDGRVIITTDMQYDRNAPLGQYPATNLTDLILAAYSAGLTPDGELNIDKTDAVFNPDFNLCCFHLVLKKR